MFVAQTAKKGMLFKPREDSTAELDSARVMLQVRKLPQVQPDKIAAVGCGHAGCVLGWATGRTSCVKGRAVFGRS